MPGRLHYKMALTGEAGFTLAELLVVVASQNPLGAIAHDLIEPAEPYIKRLADSLKRQRNKTLMAGSHYIVLTKKRDSQKAK